MIRPCLCGPGKLRGRDVVKPDPNFTLQSLLSGNGVMAHCLRALLYSAIKLDFQKSHGGS